VNEGVSVEQLLNDLGINGTHYLIHLALILVIFLLVPGFFFKPLLNLFELRDEKLIQDRERALKMMNEAQAKLDEYHAQLQEARRALRAEFDAAVKEVKAEEARILQEAREEAKKTTSETQAQIQSQVGQLRKNLETDIEGMARSVVDTLMKTT
jgi:F-type H+-transporting ATPase subunit b